MLLTQVLSYLLVIPIKKLIKINLLYLDTPFFFLVLIPDCLFKIYFYTYKTNRLPANFQVVLCKFALSLGLQMLILRMILSLILFMSGLALLVLGTGQQDAFYRFIGVFLLVSSYLFYRNLLYSA